MDAQSQRPSGPPHLIGGDSLVAHAIREALSAYANHLVTARIMQRAMHLAQEAAVPTSGARLRRFVDLHLTSAVRFVLGPDVADEVMATLKPMVGRIPSEKPGPPSAAARRVDMLAGRRRRTPAEGVAKPSSTRETKRTTRPMILLASLDATHIQDIEKQFRGRALVYVVQDVVALLDAFATPPKSPPIIVVDCAEAAVQPATIATVSEDMPPRSQVVLWGGSAETIKEAKALVDDPAAWHLCPATPVELDKLVDTLARLQNG